MKNALSTILFFFIFLNITLSQSSFVNYDIVTSDCVNFEYIITPEPGYKVTTGPLCINEAITRVNENTIANFCSPYNAITSTVIVGPDENCSLVPPYAAPRYETGGLAPGITNQDETLGAIVSLEHKHLVDEAVVIKANQVFNVQGGCGGNIDFFAPFDLGCKNISSITTSRQQGDFFECGCHDVDGTINYTDGSTYDFFFRVYVEGCSSTVACPQSQIVLMGTEGQGATITFLDYLEGNCDEYVFHNGFVNGDFAVGPEYQFDCDTETFFEIIFRDTAGDLLECAYDVRVECADGGECDLIGPEPEPCDEGEFSELYWSTFHGGNGIDEIMDMYVNPGSGLMYAIGHTTSTDFPYTHVITDGVGAPTSGKHTFVSCFDQNANLLWSTLIANWDDPHGIGMDTECNLVLCGLTTSQFLPGPSNLPGYDKTHNGGKDVMILKIEEQGQNIIYSSYYGGNGDEDHGEARILLTQIVDRKLQIEIQGDNIFFMGITNSTNLPTINPIPLNAGTELFIAAIDTREDNLLFATNYPYGSSSAGLSHAMTLDNEGKLVVLLPVQERAITDALLTSNALSRLNEYNYPLLLKFNPQFSIEYASYMFPFTTPVSDCISTDWNGTNVYDDYQLESDNCGDIYISFSERNSDKSVRIEKDKWLEAEEYYPPLDEFDVEFEEECTQTFSVIMKVNFAESNAQNISPFIERMIFNVGWNPSHQNFIVDDSKRIHTSIRNKWNQLPDYYDTPINGINYLVYNSDLSYVKQVDISEDIGNPLTWEIPNSHNGISLFDDKAIMYGFGNSDYAVTPFWTNDQGQGLKVPQDIFGGGDIDAVITIVNNNCQDPQDCESVPPQTCDNTVMDFDGSDDNIVLAGVGTQTDFTIGLWFKAGPDVGFQEDRFFGIGNSNRLEVGVDAVGNLWRYDENDGSAAYNNVRDDQWHHFAIVAEGTNRKIYLDFEKIDDYTSGSTTYGPNMRIGSWAPGPGSGSTQFSGQLDDFRGYDVAISENNICGVFNKVPADINSNLRLYFDFEEGNGDGNNTSLSVALNRGDLMDGSLEGFKLDGTVSNYVCGEYDLEQCTDDCNPDITPPDFPCDFAWPDFVLNEDGQVLGEITISDIGATDNCGSVMVTSPAQYFYDCDDISLPGDPALNTSIIVTDEAGNTAQCEVQIIVTDTNNYCTCLNDTTPPTLNCPTETETFIIGADGTVTVNYWDFDVTASDDCGSVTISGSIVNTCDNAGQSRVYTIGATDEAGNRSTCNLSYEIVDNQTPLISSCAEVVLSIGQNLLAELAVDDIESTVSDNCNYNLSVTPSSFDCSQTGLSTYVLSAIDESGNRETCSNIVRVVDDLNNCENCCLPSNDFQGLVNEGYSIENDGCQVRFSKPNIDGCSRVDVNLGNGITQSFSGQESLTYTYPADGEYEVCLTLTQRDNNDQICNENTYCTTICISCHEECENEELQYVSNSAMVQPYLGYFGSINRRTDVCLTSNDVRYSAASFNSIGNHDGEDPHEIRIYREDILCKTFTNDAYCQVSEIQEKNGFLYLTGSFVGTNFSMGGYTLVGNGGVNNRSQPHAFVAKMDLDCQVIWAFSFGGPWLHVVEDIDILENGDFAITGTTRHSVDFDPHPNIELKPTESPDIITGYVARYSDDGVGLPTADWVELIYTSPEVISGFVHGLGVTFDENEDVYAVGDYKIENETGAPCIGLQLTSYGNTSYGCTNNNNLYTTPANYSALGYLIKYNGENGNPEWMTRIDDNNTTQLSNGVCPRDVELLDNNIYTVGTNFITKHDKSSGLLLSHTFNRGMELEEIAIFDDKLHLVGFRNSYYQLGTTSESYTPSGTMILAVSDLDCNIYKWLSPGYTTKRNYGKSIAVNESRISVTGEITLSEGLAFQLQYPEVGPLVNMPSEYSFLVADYECFCPGVSNTSCCEDLSTAIQETPAGEYCCSISISNDFGFDLPKVGVKLNDSNAGFSLSETALDKGYTILNMTSNYAEIQHISGSIPTGSNDDILEFCLFSENANSSGPQTFEIQYFQGSGDGMYISCTEELAADCDNSAISICGDLTVLSTTCLDPESNLYELNIRVTNNGTIDNLTNLQLHSFPNGYQWLSCNTSTLSEIGYTVDVGNLSAGQSSEFCVRLITSVTLSELSNIEFNASFGSNPVELYCTGTGYEFQIEPCCIECQGFDIVLDELSSCCYNIGLDNVCSAEIPYAIFFEGINGKIVNSNYESEYLAAGSTESDDVQIFWPLPGFSVERDLKNIFVFCLDADNSESPSLRAVIAYDIVSGGTTACEETVQTNCSGDCVIVGFNDTSLDLLGSGSESYSLGCGSPPVPIACPDGKDMWVRGNFGCSSGCDASLEIRLEYEDGTISWTSNVESDGSWETLLNDYIDSPGEYRLRVRGNCDSWHTICYYSFIVPEDCYSCDCIDLENDVALGFNNVQQGFCEVINTPYALNECDEVTWFVNNIEGGQTTGNEEFQFAIVSGTHEVCMSVVRTENNICQAEQCYTFEVDCNAAAPLVIGCGETANTNGDFAIGDYMSLHESDIPIPGWKYNSGEAWFFENGGAYGDDSGYMHIAATKFEEASMEVLLDASMYEASSSENSIKVFFDLKTYSSLEEGNFVLRLRDGSLSDDILVPFEGTDDNVWRTVDLDLPLPDNILINGNETLEFVQFREDIFSNTSFSIDNVCVEVKTMTTSVNELESQLAIQLYPNPTHDKIYLVSENKNLKRYEIYSTNGLLLKSDLIQEDMNVDVTQLDSGVYFIQFYDNKSGNQIAKFIKL